MKKAILAFCTALVLAGCGQNQGGTSDQTGSSVGSTTSTNQPSSSSSVNTPSSNIDTNTATTNSSAAKP